MVGEGDDIDEDGEVLLACSVLLKALRGVSGDTLSLVLAATI